MGPLLADRFAARAAARPHDLAVAADGGGTTYGALAAQAEAAARALSGRRRIAILPRAEAASLAVVLGAMTVGTSVVLVDRHLTAAQAERVLAVAAPELIVTAGRHPRPLLERVAPERVVAPQALVGGAGRAAVEREAAERGAAGARDGRAADEEAGAEVALPRRARPDDEMLVGLTSGTSGEPKLFARDQASWATTLDRSDQTFDVRPGDVVSAAGPLDHSHFFYGALHALTRGATVDLRPLATAFGDGDGAAFAEVTHVYLVPALAVDLVALLGERPREHVREVMSSAAPWPQQARERLARLLPAATVTHFYGASELSFVAREDSCTPPPRAGASRPFDGVEIELRGPDGAPLPDGEQGEVHVRSDMLFSGYLTPAGLVGGPDADGWLTVGDLGTLRDGWLSLAGRGSETIVSGGFNVEPAHVEQALAGLPGVREVACVGLPDERWGVLPVAVLVLDGAAPPPTRAQVRDHVRAALPQPSRPRRVLVAEQLPRSPRGKLLRPRLAAQVAAGELRELG
ncbi:MAG TPA: AMP-binding protein [Conexibacter sp.]|nr:AMP-binding protein [Conexibacter sp.]